MKCEKSENHTISYQSLLLSTTVLYDNSYYFVFLTLANPDQTQPPKPKGEEPEKSIVIHTLTIDITYLYT